MCLCRLLIAWKKLILKSSRVLFLFIYLSNFLISIYFIFILHFISYLCYVFYVYVYSFIETVIGNQFCVLLK